MRDFMKKQGAEYFIAFPPLFSLVLGTPETRNIFVNIKTARSPHYTVILAPQNEIVVYKLR